MTGITLNVWINMWSIAIYRSQFLKTDLPNDLLTNWNL